MLVRQEALESIDFGGLKIFDYTAQLTSDSSLALIEVPPGASHAEAWSRRSDKYYLVISGEIEFALDNEEYALAKGDFCLVKQGERFKYRNSSSFSATLVLVHTPSFDLEAEEFVAEHG